MQPEWAWRVHLRTGGNVLILCPLAVAAQTVREGSKFGIAVTHCRKPEDVRSGINIVNYERLEGFDASAFAGVVLDESSILKSFDGATKTMLCEMFSNTPFRLCNAPPRLRRMTSMSWGSIPSSLVRFHPVRCARLGSSTTRARHRTHGA